MSYPSLESILSLVLEPEVDWSTIEELSGEVYDGLEAAAQALEGESGPGDGRPVVTKVRNALASFHVLRLALASYLEDYENWGDDWKRYAARYVPAEHKVRLMMERANTRD